MSDGGSKLDIHSFDTLPSTQTYLVDRIRRGEITHPIAVITEEQTAGRGSRHTTWEGRRGDLLTSIALKISDLPADILPQSASVYFAYLIKEILAEIAPDIYLKWPNDLYQKGGKVGGVITQKLKGFYVVGVGVNLGAKRSRYGAIESDVTARALLDRYRERLEAPPTWKDLFSKIKVEFEHSRTHFFHKDGAQISLQDARLCEDGSLEITGERMYSLR